MPAFPVAGVDDYVRVTDAIALQALTEGIRQLGQLIFGSGQVLAQSRKSRKSLRPVNWIRASCGLGRRTPAGWPIGSVGLL